MQNGQPGGPGENMLHRLKLKTAFSEVSTLRSGCGMNGMDVVSSLDLNSFLVN